MSDNAYRNIRKVFRVPKINVVAELSFDVNTCSSKDFESAD